MKSFTVCALLAAAVNAIPVHEAGHLAGYHHHAKRALVWVTETDVDTVTIDVTKTIWADAPASTQEAYHPHGYSHGGQSQSSAAQETTSAYVAPTTSAYVAPTTSAYVAPTTSAYEAPTTPSTSAYVAPTTASTSAYVAPTTSSEEVAPTSYTAPAESTYVPSTTAAATTTGTGSGSGTYPTSSGSAYSGDFTWYDTGVGACGNNSLSTDPIVAMAAEIWDYWLAESGETNPNNNPLCGQQVSMTGVDGQQHIATIVDRCPGCAPGALDLAHGIFTTVTGQTDGRIPDSKWEFC